MKVLCAIALFAVIVFAAGCQPGKNGSSASSGGAGGRGPAAKPVFKPAADTELAKLHVNEAGLIPILEYHRIRKGRTTYDRSPEEFRKDLERPTTEGYRPAALR